MKRCALDRRGKMLWLVLMLVAAVAGLVWAIVTWWNGPHGETLTGRAFGADYHITIIRPPQVDAAAVQQAIAATLDRVDRLLSSYRSDSDVSRLNAAEPGQWTPVAAETAHAIHTALDIGRRSGGAFDVTIGPLVNLWGFGPQGKRAEPPSDAEIAAAQKFVGLDKLEVRLDPPAARRMAAGVQIDLSSLGDGYAADLVAADLSRLGIDDYCVEIGGEILTRGRNSQGKPWQLAVEVPDPERLAVERIVPLSGGALSTSGDYHNYYEEQGVRYCHIIDPQTGRPVQHRTASVTVIGPTCLPADIWSTALMVPDIQRAMEIAQREGLAALFIVHTPHGFAERWTPEFEKYR